MKKSLLFVMIATTLLALTIILCSCQTMETTTDVTSTQSTPVAPPTDRGKSYNFDSYDELQSVVSGSKSQEFQKIVETEAPRLVPMLGCLTQRNAIPKPYLNGKLWALRGNSSVFLLEQERHKAPIILYHCEYKGIHVRVRVSYIDLFNIELRDAKMNIASFTEMLNPKYPSPDNYHTIEWSEMVVDKTMVIGGENVFVRAITGADTSYDRIDYLHNGLYISIEAPDLLEFDESFFQGFTIE